MPTFIPDPIDAQQADVPFYEESQKLAIPGRGTEKSVQKLQGEIIDLIARLGGGAVVFTPGQYREGERVRHGFQVMFWYGSARGRIDCAALPIRRETARVKDRALAQALYLLRDELQAQVYSQTYKPGAVPLIPYLMNGDGQTVTEFMVATQNVPQLMAGSNGR